MEDSQKKLFKLLKKIKFHTLINLELINLDVKNYHLIEYPSDFTDDEKLVLKYTKYPEKMKEYFKISDKDSSDELLDIRESIFEPKIFRNEINRIVFERTKKLIDKYYTGFYVYKNNRGTIVSKTPISEKKLMKANESRKELYLLLEYPCAKKFDNKIQNYSFDLVAHTNVSLEKDCDDCFIFSFGKFDFCSGANRRGINQLVKKYKDALLSNKSILKNVISNISILENYTVYGL